MPSLSPTDFTNMERLADVGLPNKQKQRFETIDAGVFLSTGTIDQSETFLPSQRKLGVNIQATYDSEESACNFLRNKLIRK